MVRDAGDAADLLHDAVDLRKSETGASRASALLLRQVVQIGTSVTLARLLVPEDFGVLGMAMVFVGVAAINAAKLPSGGSGWRLRDSLPGKAALRAYRQAIALDPKLADAHVNLGWLLHEAGNLAQAERAYRDGIAACGPDSCARALR